jgi:hypothetical protein
MLDLGCFGMKGASNSSAASVGLQIALKGRLVERHWHTCRMWDLAVVACLTQSRAFQEKVVIVSNVFFAWINQNIWRQWNWSTNLRCQDTLNCIIKVLIHIMNFKCLANLTLNLVLHHHHHHHHPYHPHHHHWKDSPFWTKVFLRRFCQICLFLLELDHPVFTSLDFDTVILLQSKIVSLASNPQTRGPGLCIYVPQWQGTGFPFRRLLPLAGLRWSYTNPPPHGTFWYLRFISI